MENPYVPHTRKTIKIYYFRKITIKKVFEISNKIKHVDM